MNKIVYAMGPLLLLTPAFAFAAPCSPLGATIVYVNGIETTQQEANNDTTLLSRIFSEYGGSPDIQIITGYNPTHLDGIGDELESLSQAFGTPISDYDLDTILTQIAPKVTTRKILLVGHSQGTFYTNEMYDYLVQNGVPPQSVAVYNIATPASSVAGNGTYLTSANDKVIEYVRELEAEANTAQALPANIIIPEEPGYAANAWGGHFPDVYLGGAPQRIASDIEHALSKLSTGANMSGKCFAPPALGFSYEIQETLFSVADPAIATMDYAAVDTNNTVASVMDNANDIIHATFADAYFSVFPKPDIQSAASVFAVEKALYGSSLSVADYEALASGQDIPEVQTPAQDPQPVQPVAQAEPQQEAAVPNNPPTPPEQPKAAPAAIPLVAVSPGFGGGLPVTASPDVPIPSPTPASQMSTTSAATTAIPIPADPQAISTTTLPFSVILPTDQTVFSTSTIAFSGTTSPNATVYASFATSTSSTSADQSGNWSFQLTLTAGTTTVSLSSADALGDYSATSSLSLGVTFPVVPVVVSPVIDTFDAAFSGWQNYLPGYTAASWDTTPSDCYSGNCLSETSYNQQYESVKIGTPLTSGSFVLYFRNDGYGGQFGAGVCTTDSDSECGSASSFGGTDALIAAMSTVYRDNLWHYLYFAFRDGSANKEHCSMVDDADPADCVWQGSSVANGTTYSGVVFFSANGLNPGTSFYWDELGTVPRPPGVQ